MRISIVTVAYNAERSIAETVRSVLDQEYGSWELVVVDGASTDRTCEVVRSFDDPRIVLVSEPDAGIYDAMNKGLRRFTGDAVGFLNADDRYHDRGALGAIAAALSRHDAVHGHLDFVDAGAGGQVVRRWRAEPRGSFRYGWMPAHPTFYARRAVIERTGPFDASMRVGADYDFMLRALEGAPWSVGLVDRVLVDMRIGGRSTSGIGAYVRGNLEALAARRRHLGSGLVDVALFAKPGRKLLQWF
jgi:glycosyltransferase involved in cell wall biosynthesis